MPRTITLTLLALLVAADAISQRVVNARVETRSANAGVEQAVRAITDAQSGAAWIGYLVPAIAGREFGCCACSGGCTGCRLESASGVESLTAGVGPVPLEPAEDLAVLVRVADRRIVKVRMFDARCDLDAGGLPFYRLTDVRSPDSVSFLQAVADRASGADPDASGQSRLVEAALSALAFHRDASADAALERFLEPQRPLRVREKAAFWMGHARGRHGLDVLTKLVREDADDRLRKRVVFAISQSREPAAVDVLISLAKTDRSATVRGEAIFWLAHKAQRKAAEAITDAIQNDPETEVKRKAVFALTQLPNKDEGVQLLIQIARMNKNPVVRKQAMFWLGQSKDPRAVAFFEEVLRK